MTEDDIKMTTDKLTDNEIITIQEMYDKGHTMDDIRIKTGRSFGAISKYVRSRRLQHNIPPIPEPTKQEKYTPISPSPYEEYLKRERPSPISPSPYEEYLKRERQSRIAPSPYTDYMNRKTTQHIKITIRKRFSDEILIDLDI